MSAISSRPPSDSPATQDSTESPDTSTAVPDFGPLCGVEFRRLFARRFVRVLAVLAVLGYLIALVATFLTHSRVTAADLAQATRQRDGQISQIKHEVANCSKGLPAAKAQEQCGTVPGPSEFPADQFLHNHPFQPAQVSDYALVVGVALALLSFVVAATFIGAEWSSKNLIAWLFWEPRRLRLMVAKLLALLSVALAISILAQAVWFGVAHLLLHYRGLPVSSLGRQAHHFWAHVVDKQMRAALLVVPAALLGFGLANLVRNTAAAFGVGFVYFAVAETAVRSLDPDWQPYLFTTNVAAWVNSGGLTVYGKDVFNQRQGAVIAREIHVSNLHGGITLLIYAAAILTASLIVFRRRDIT